MACTLDELVEASKCFNCLSPSERQKAFLFYLATTLNELTDENFTDINDLRAAVICWCETGQYSSFKAQVAVELAVNSGAIDSTPTIAEVRDNIRCWCDIGIDEMKGMEAFLLCKVLDFYGNE